jgi:long-chain acyl-CoA synthetase
MVLRAGENIYSAEVEASIYELAQIHECAVFGLPHERLGEEVACVIMLKPGMTATVDLKTGGRSVLKYLIKPVYKAFGGALTEK